MQLSKREREREKFCQRLQSSLPSLSLSLSALAPLLRQWERQAAGGQSGRCRPYRLSSPSLVQAVHAGAAATAAAAAVEVQGAPETGCGGNQRRVEGGAVPEVSHSVVRLSVCVDVPLAGERAIAGEAAAAPHSVGRSRARRAYVRRYSEGGRENRWAYRFGAFSSRSVCLLPFCLGARTSLWIWPLDQWQGGQWSSTALAESSSSSGWSCSADELVGCCATLLCWVEKIWKREKGGVWSKCMKMWMIW